MPLHRRHFLQSISTASILGMGFHPANCYAAYDDVLTIGPRNQEPDLPILRQKTGQAITKIETYTHGSTLCMVKVMTGDGREGIGQISTYDADISAQVLHRKLAQIALGQDPADVRSIVDRSIEANYKYPWSYVCRALSGIDTAIFDWLGKHENKSVCELLGGTPRPFPVYGSSMSRQIKPSDEAERLKKLRDEFGYEAFKIRVGSVNGHDQDQWEGRTGEIIPTVRKGVGENIALLADANSCYTPTKAIEVGKRMQDHNYIQFEEPCPYWELEWTKEVTDTLDMKVSGGEQDNELATWRRMINMHAVDIVQPDPLYLGGVIQTLRVAKKAEQAGLPCVPHSANRAMVTLFAFHLMGAIPNAGNYVEYSIEDTSWSDNLFEPGFKVVDGKVSIPDGPGWGVTVNQEWLENADREVSEV